MKIVIDARFWGPAHTGLGVYTKNLVLNLCQLDSHNKYLVLLRKETYYSLDLPTNFQKKVVEISAYTLAEQLVLPWIIYRFGPDLVHFPSINVPILYLGSYIVTVHDLIKQKSKGILTTTQPPLVYWLKYVSYLLVFRWVVFFAKKIIVPSETVKSELVKDYGLSEQKIRITYEAASLDGVKAKFGQLEKPLPPKFALHVGNAYPHKNLERLIDAWREVFDQSSVQLVLCSGRTVFRDRVEKTIERKGADKYVRFLGFVQDQELVALYQKALIYVFPTLLEGFGLPGLDAMRLGVPVVCSNIAVLKEVYGSAAYYFDPTDQKSMAKTILRVIEDVTIRKALVDLGKKRVKRYTWQAMASKTLDTYESSSSL